MYCIVYISFFHHVKMLLPYIVWAYLYLSSVTIFDTSMLVYAAYNVSESVINKYSFIRPFSQIGAATFVRDDVFYTMGGLSQYLNRTMPTTNFVAFQLNQQTGDIEVAAASRMVPQFAYGQAVLLADNDRVLIFGGYTGELTDKNRTLVVQEYQFSVSDLRTLNVTAANNATNGRVPMNRYKHTATLAPNGKVYIYGGQIQVPLQDSFLTFGNTILPLVFSLRFQSITSLSARYS